MTLTLRAVSLNDHPLTQPITAHFDAGGGSVGRSDHNTLALPDPERHISRQQAEISVSGTDYVIKNVGSANPITVRGQALGRGESAPLANHDQVRIGGYLLEVIHDAAGSEASTVVRNRAAVDASTAGVVRPAAGSGQPPPAALGDLGTPLSRSNPFADLLGDAPPTPALEPAAASSAQAAHPSQAARAPHAPHAIHAAPTPRVLLPDDFDPFAPPPAPAPAPALFDTGAAQRPAGVFDDLIPSGAPTSIDDLFDLQGQGRDPLADFMADVSAAPIALPSRPGEPPVPTPSTDPMAMFERPGKISNAPAWQSTMRDDTPDLNAAFSPPLVRPEPEPVRAPVTALPRAASPGLRGDMPAAAASAASPPSPAASASLASSASPAPPVASPWRGDPQALWAALCKGAGVSVAPPEGVTPELMNVVGSLLRAAVVGTLQLMTVRATAKHELHAQVTMIQARNNNPMKFSPDARSALEQMLQPPMRGFLAGPAAMTDAMHDLVGHSIGTMAGTRAALEGVLDRFTPQQLEAKLAGRSVLDSVLPMNRKAKLWELYLQHFDAIRGEAHDDFHSLFGRAFLAAYEQQLDRLQEEERADRSPHRETSTPTSQP